MSRPIQDLIERYYKVLGRWSGNLIVILLVLAAFYFFSDILTWVLLAWVLSLVAMPILNALGKIKLNKKQLPQSVRAIFTIIIIYGLTLMLVGTLIPPLMKEVKHLSGVDYTKVQASLKEPIGQLEAQLNRFGINLNNKVATKDSLATKTYPQPYDTSTIKLPNGQTIIRMNVYLNGSNKNLKPAETSISDFDNLQKKLFDYFSPSRISQIVGSFVNVLGNLFVAIASITFILFFFLSDPKLFDKVILSLVPIDQEENTQGVLYRIKRMLPRYFQSILIELLILMGYLLLTLTLFGVPNSVLIAFIGALMNIVPYVGPLLGGFFGLFITVCSHIEADFYTVTFPLMGWVLGIFITSQWFDNFLLQPIIFSKSVKAHPLEIFIVILVGAKIFGITGMIIAVPPYPMLRYIAAEFFSHIKFFNQLTGHLNEEEEEEEEKENEDENEDLSDDEDNNAPQDQTPQINPPPQ